MEKDELIVDEELDKIEEFDEENGMFEHFRLNVDKGQTPMRVDKYMATHLEDTSRHRVQCAIKNGYVRVNDKIAKANLIVRPDDVIRFVMPYKRRGMEILPENIPLNIVYEDDDFLIVNKQAGMCVHPGHGHFDGTLINALSYHLGISQGPEAEDERMGILVHRIDKDTSGLLVVAKNDEAQLNLAKQFFDHSIDRRYVAIVWGNIKEDEGTITGNIGRDPNDRMRFKGFPEGDHGKHAVTHYKVLERFGFVTVVECRLETGRTHQIRVHMAHIGHPLMGDSTYGGGHTTFEKHNAPLIDGQMLHAYALILRHPRTNEEMRFETPLGENFAAILDKLRAKEQ